MGQPGNVPQDYSIWNAQQAEVEMVDADREQREREREIGYRIDNYPEQTTGQQR
jgi:hypothetical protein